MGTERPRTLGELRASGYRMESVKDEMRRNLIAQAPGGRAALPRHPRLRGDGRPPDPERDPVAARHALPRPPRPGQDADAPPARPPARRRHAGRRRLGDQRPSLRTRSRKYARDLVAEQGDDTPIAWVGREPRYHEKLATPDVTIADLIGEVDMIKHAEGRYLSSELTMHFGLIPRTNRGIFCINELPDLAPKIQVGLFNVLEERDVQIRGYPDPARARPLHGLLGQPRGLHQPRPDRHAAEGPDRLGRPDALPAHPGDRHRDQRAERLARPATATAPVAGDPASTSRRSSRRSPGWRGRSPHVNQQSGVSVRMSIANLENVVSNAERRALLDRRGAGSCRGSPT